MQTVLHTFPAQLEGEFKDLYHTGVLQVRPTTKTDEWSPFNCWQAMIKF